LLPVVFRAVVFKLLVWCGAEGYVSGLQDACWFTPASILQTGHITLSSAPDQQVENHSTKYHRQQPLSGLQDACWSKPASILQTGHITLNSAPDQQLENHSTKYHRQQPLYNAVELLMMGIVMSKTCLASNKIYNKNLCCI